MDKEIMWGNPNTLRIRAIEISPGKWHHYKHNVGDDASKVKATKISEDTWHELREKGADILPPLHCEN